MKILREHLNSEWELGGKSSDERDRNTYRIRTVCTVLQMFIRDIHTTEEHSDVQRETD